MANGWRARPPWDTLPRLGFGASIPTGDHDRAQDVAQVAGRPVRHNGDVITSLSDDDLSMCCQAGVEPEDRVASGRSVAPPRCAVVATRGDKTNQRTGARGEHTRSLVAPAADRQDFQQGCRIWRRLRRSALVPPTHPRYRGLSTARPARWCQAVQAPPSRCPASSLTSPALSATDRPIMSAGVRNPGPGERRCAEPTTPTGPGSP
jgi:hypothetical protein